MSAGFSEEKEIKVKISSPHYLFTGRITSLYSLISVDIHSDNQLKTFDNKPSYIYMLYSVSIEKFK